MKRAFTIVELLIVIAIISILAALLFPVINKAEGAARRTRCINVMSFVDGQAEHTRYDVQPHRLRR